MKSLSFEELSSVSGGDLCDKEFRLNGIAAGLAIAAVTNAISVMVASAVIAGFSLGCTFRRHGIK